jgi:hypothetical protein
MRVPASSFASWSAVGIQPSQRRASPPPRSVGRWWPPWPRLLLRQALPPPRLEGHGTTSCSGQDGWARLWLFQIRDKNTPVLISGFRHYTAPPPPTHIYVCIDSWCIHKRRTEQNVLSPCSWRVEHDWKRVSMLRSLQFAFSVLRADKKYTVSDTHHRCGQITWRVSDRYERLVTVAVEVLATPCWKHLSQVSVLDSSSSRAVEYIVWVTWTFCLCFKI